MNCRFRILVAILVTLASCEMNAAGELNKVREPCTGSDPFSNHNF